MGIDSTQAYQCETLQSHYRELILYVTYVDTVTHLQQQQRQQLKARLLSTHSMLSTRRTSSSAIAERPRDPSCLSVVSTIPRAQFLLLVTSASALLVRTIRFCFVVFGVTSSLAVIHTILYRVMLCQQTR